MGIFSKNEDSCFPCSRRRSDAGLLRAAEVSHELNISAATRDRVDPGKRID